MSKIFIDFTAPVPPELFDIEDKLIDYFRWAKIGMRTEYDSSGLGKQYEPERGELEDKRKPAPCRMRDSDAMDVSRALARVPDTPVQWHTILCVHYIKKYAPPATMSRKLKGVRAQTWIAERNKALHMLKSIMARGAHKIPIRLSEIKTQKAADGTLRQMPAKVNELADWLQD